MSDSEESRPRQFGLRTVFLVFFVLAVLLGVWTLRSQQRRASVNWVRASPYPVSLRVIYTESPRTTNGDDHMANVTYVFENRLPEAVKLAFPPISYTTVGTVPFAVGSGQVEQMPAFCREPQLVEIPAQGECCFHGACIYSGPEYPTPVFLFGNPTGSDDPSLVLVCVQGTCERAESDQGK